MFKMEGSGAVCLIGHLPNQMKKKVYFHLVDMQLNLSEKN